MNGSLARVPCTIVTGFLGAGKTTLIRHVLANAQGRRLAVIVNEFGDVGIDGEILKGCGDERARRRISSNSPTGACAARWPTNSCRRSTPFWRATASSTSSSKRRASRCRSRWCRHSIGRRSRAASPSTASSSLSTARLWPMAAWRTISNALAQQRVTDTALAHDDPIEEVFEDQVACADLVVLNKRDLIDAAGSRQGSGGDRRSVAAQRQDHHCRRRQGRSGAAARAWRRHRGRYRQPPHAPRRRGRSRSRRFRLSSCR